MRFRTVISLAVAAAILGATPALAAPAGPPPAASSPVERPIQGDLGMSFVFGGLAPLSVAGLVQHTVNRLFFTEVGIRYMIGDKWMLPFSFGAGLWSLSPSGGDSQNDLGLSFSVGFIRYFRIWRRIAPYFGAKLHIHYVDPTGGQNYLVQFALGPQLGIEYFIADRVSLNMEYSLLFGLNSEDNQTSIGLQTIVSMGGQMGLNFYF